MKRVAVLLIALFLPSISAAMPLDIDSLPPNTTYNPGHPLDINTPLGDVHFVGDVQGPIPSDTGFIAAGASGNVLDILNRPPPGTPGSLSFAELMFDFDVFAITFIYSTGRTGVFNVITRNISGDILYEGSLTGNGPITIYGEGIRSFYWSDPGKNYAAIDNVDLNLPEPASLLLLGTGLGILWLGICRRK
jgi:hypothetical protein